MNEVRQMCVDMELEYIDSVEEINSKEKAHIVYNIESKQQELYSKEELKNKYLSFLDK